MQGMDHVKKRIIISLISILILIMALFGITYAYFTTKAKGNEDDKSASVTAGKLEVTYKEGNGEIVAEKLMPGDVVASKTFSVVNTGTATTDYLVIVENVINTLVNNEDLEYELVCNSSITGKNCNGSKTSFPNKKASLVKNSIDKEEVQNYTLTLTYKETNKDQSSDMDKVISAKVNISTEERFTPFDEGTFAYTIYNNAKNATGDKTIYQETPTTSPGNAISTYKFDTNTNNVLLSNSSTMSVSSTYQGYYWIYGTGYTINESNGYFTLTGVNSLSSSSKIYADMYSDLVGKYLISSSVSDNSASSTSTANPKRTSNISSIYKVTAATSSQITYKQILPQTVGVEKTLSKSEDDYGDSYYYRGKVIDNYVNFAGMCWRIVRIAGDGSVKLILEDQNTTCNSSSYTGNWNLGSANFGYDQSTYGSSKYIINYLNPVSNASSALVNKFKTFQTGTLTTKISSTYSGKGLSDYLKAGDWCYDDTAYTSDTSTSGTPLTEEQKINYYNGTTSGYFYYDSYIRLKGQSTKTPTNKCNGTTLNKFSDDTDMYVATLIADEIVYAGGKTYSNNYGYYLLNDYQRINFYYWWPLSPSRWMGSNSGAFLAMPYGYLHDGFVNGNGSYYSSRPSIQLKSKIEISGGDGTQQNPYIVK